MFKSKKWELILVSLVLMSLPFGNNLEKNAPRTITFSGYEWEVRSSSTAKSDPGPNYFAGSEEDVWVDMHGQLHLKITERNGRWYCSEVAAKASLGYGKYIFQLSTRPEKLDKNTVVGLFTYDNNPKYHHREIDIEFSRWGQDKNENAYYTVQPWDRKGNMKGFNFELESDSSTHVFDWSPDYIVFQSFSGHHLSPTVHDGIVESWTYDGSDIPPSGQERALIDFWLNKGRPPSNGQDAEIVIKAFEFKRMNGN